MPTNFTGGHLPAPEHRIPPGTKVTVTLTVTGYVAADGLISDGQGGVMLCDTPHHLARPSHVAYAGERDTAVRPVPDPEELYQEVSALHATTHHGAFERESTVTVHGPEPLTADAAECIVVQGIVPATGRQATADETTAAYQLLISTGRIQEMHAAYQRAAEVFVRWNVCTPAE